MDSPVSKSITALFGSLLLLSTLWGCTPTGNTTVSTLPFNPCCALTIAEPVGGGFGSDNLLVSQRRGDPDQTQWSQLAGQPGAFQASFRGFGFGTTLQDIKVVDLPLVNGAHEVHLLAVIFSMMNVANFGWDLAEIIQDSTGNWGSFTPMSALVPAGLQGGPIGSDLGRTANFQRISAAVVGGVLNACAVEDRGQIEVNRLINGRWEGWTDVERATSGKTGIIPDGQFTDVGQFVDVGCASVMAPAGGTEQLHICGVTADGKLWHSIETSPFMFTQFGNVQDVIGKVGDFTRVDCVGNQSQLHLVGVAKDGRGWHTMRIPSGAWQQFENVFDQAGSGGIISSFSGPFGDVAIGFCNDYVTPDDGRDVSQLNTVFTSKPPVASNLWFTIRAANLVRWRGSLAPQHWRPLQDISSLIERPADVQNQQGNRTNDPDSPNWNGFSIGSRPFSP